MEFKGVLYINGVKHHVTEISARLFADCDTLPGRPCSEHRIGDEAALALRNGVRVRTLGNLYSASPMTPEEAQVLNEKLSKR